MVLVLISAVGLAALRSASDLWAGMMLLFALAAVGIAVMAAVILRGRERYWWAGFAFFAGGYLALAVGPWLSDTFQPQLGTTHLLRYVHVRLSPDAAWTAAEFQELDNLRMKLIAQLDHLRRTARSTKDPAIVSRRAELAKADQRLATMKNAAPPQRPVPACGSLPLRPAGGPGGWNRRHVVLLEAREG